ncbi:methyltransferase domain-containing protein [Rhodanobacter denitrificans]|nr:methyltransferase domain-containing protein [Rhodanobacter denitrificans]
MRGKNQKMNSSGRKGIRPSEDPNSLFSLAQELSLEEIMQRLREDAHGSPAHEQKQANPDAHESIQSTEPPRAPLPLPHELSLEEIMVRVQKEVRRRRDESAQGTSGAVTVGPAGNGGLPRWESSLPRLPVSREYVLKDLLQFADADFIDTAYRIILRRPADAAGREHFLAALRAGHLSKVEILGLIRFSDEGMQRGVHVDGLLLPYKLHRWRHLPVIGRVLAFAMAVIRLPRLAMQLQTMENAAARESQDIGRLLNRVDEAVEGRFVDVDNAVGLVRTELLQSITARAEDLREIVVRADSLQMIVEARGDELRAYKAEREQHDRNMLQQLGEQGSVTASLADELRAHKAEREQRDDDMLRQLGAQGSATARLGASAYENHRSLLDVQRRLMAFLDTTVRQVPESGEHAIVDHVSAGDQVLNAQYVSFEDEFRGEREDIKMRAAHYLEALAAAGIEHAGGVVLDLGCGRGEWLEVLSEQGYTCRGVDLNSVMLEDSLVRGFDVVEADAVDYLRGLADDSLAAITSMHLVEHLPHNVLIRLLDEAIRVLRPGGVLILETPNPENLTVGSCWFYLDPTHRNPIPPALLQWIVQQRGFAQPVIERLSEHRGVPDIQRVSEDVPGAAQINQMIEWFTAAPDYAVIARKP